MSKREGYTSDQELIALIKAVTAKGGSAEVKRTTDGGWVVYGVKKERFTIK